MAVISVNASIEPHATPLVRKTRRIAFPYKIYAKLCTLSRKLSMLKFRKVDLKPSQRVRVISAAKKAQH